MLIVYLLFEEPITFDQTPKSDRLFASEVNGHARATTYSRFQAFRLLISSTITFFFFLGKVLYLTISNCTAGFQALDEQYYNSWLHRFSDEELLLCVCLLEFVFLLYKFLNLP